MISRLNATIRDPGLGIAPANTGRLQMKFGVCNKGAPNTVYSAGGVNPAKDAIGSGPAFEAGAQVLDVAGGPVLFTPVTPSTYGTVTGAFTLVGSATATVTGSKGPEQIVRVKIILGGALATMTFQVAIGSGAYGSTVTSGADPYTYQVPGQYFTKLAFAVGTYVTNDIYTLNLDGTVTRTGTGTATLLDGSTHSPVDAYDIRILITKAGALGAAAFQYSLDGGNTYNAGGDIGVPAAGKYVIPGTGIVLTFSGTFVAADLYSGTATAASFGTSDLNSAFTAALASPLKWKLFHVVGTAANAAACATLASAVEAQCLAAKAVFKYIRGVIECPQSESDSTIATALASFVSEDGRVSIYCGDVYLQSRVTGRKDKRNGAWAYMARLSATKLSSHPGQVERSNGGGALRNVTSIIRNEFNTPALDAARFVTTRDYAEIESGYFITDGVTFAAAGSDFSSIMNGRVMDRICDVTRAVVINYLNKDIRVDGDTGYIDERDAQDIEDEVRAQLRATIFAEDEVSTPPECAVSRTDNILSTSTVNVEVSVIPKGYARIINLTLGFKNPALRAAA
jgi:hypothetical protein